ncbi:MAG TPA: peptidoglycan-associated lipoprotein Pal [Nitrospirae bacterium]|nr:outer membrane lipoprotein Omp16 precursor [bacterium BMS3Abin09]GBE41776.1 outer membrane lipoprotein Omp16 precursor [bacterium BMS3Bbin09]HDH34445.1 peptidoglycan-associated lipoprotein Pal [Nitrospirota bacterium]HDN94993.1 peptidoglycan-associated lipoprotein Pal [Nitrospirota bacterium]HDZ83861.1 peptidoglycan-associated lipoprotein Pal [Nitrospirota bacterium]
MKKTLLIFLLILMVGCSKQYTKAPEVVVAPAGKATEQMAAPEGIEEEFVEEVISTGEDRNISEAVISPEEEALSVFKDIMFDYDKYSIRPDARPTLDNVAAFLYKNKKFNVVIEGHCDDRGTNEYNLALGEKRAKSAQGYLSSLGVLPSRMMIMTYGEEKPLCMGQDEICWQRNRRAHFILVK